MINPILLIAAMEREAKKIIHYFNMELCSNIFDARLPMLAFRARDYPHLWLVLNGKCTQHRCDRIGIRASAISTWESIKQLSPTLIINIGTAGGFKARGARINDVYISTSISFHDSNSPVKSINRYLVGNYKTHKFASLANEFELKSGAISTGNAVYTSAEQMKKINNKNVCCKDMESAAIAEVAELADIDMFAVKVITDLVDSEQEPHKQFALHADSAIDTLSDKVSKIVEHLLL